MPAQPKLGLFTVAICYLADMFDQVENSLGLKGPGWTSAADMARSYEQLGEQMEAWERERAKSKQAEETN